MYQWEEKNVCQHRYILDWSWSWNITNSRPKTTLARLRFLPNHSNISVITNWSFLYLQTNIHVSRNSCWELVWQRYKKIRIFLISNYFKCLPITVVFFHWENHYISGKKLKKRAVRKLHEKISWSWMGQNPRGALGPSWLLRVRHWQSHFENNWKERIQPNRKHAIVGNKLPRQLRPL